MSQSLHIVHNLDYFIEVLFIRIAHDAHIFADIN